MLYILEMAAMIDVLWLMQGRTGFLVDLFLGALTIYAIAIYIASTYNELAVRQGESEIGCGAYWTPRTLA